MNPFRPYQAIHTIVSDSSKVYSCACTINLFDVESYVDASNELEDIKDNIKRTIVFLPGKTFMLEVPYKEFDYVMTKFLNDFQMRDDRSLIKPDKMSYSGPIKANFGQNKDAISVTFHREDFHTTNYEEFLYHCIFNNITPMN